MSIATYSFLPYLRQGISNNLQSSGGARGTFTVKIDIHGDATVTPANDKTGRDLWSRAISWASMCARWSKPTRITGSPISNRIIWPISIFTTKIFPGAIHPSRRAQKRLNPWIYPDHPRRRRIYRRCSRCQRPLPYITLKEHRYPTSFFPKKDQLWAWAHVHFNGDLTGSDSTIVTDDADGR